MTQQEQHKTAIEAAKKAFHREYDPGLGVESSIRAYLEAIGSHPCQSNPVVSQTTASVAVNEAGAVAQEPIATVAEIGAGGHRWLVPHPLSALDHLPIGTPLYAAPQPAAQEPTDGAIYAAVSKRQFSDEENAAIDRDISAKFAAAQEPVAVKATDHTPVSSLECAEVTHEDVCNTNEGGPCNCDWSAARAALSPPSEPEMTAVSTTDVDHDGNHIERLISKTEWGASREPAPPVTPVDHDGTPFKLLPIDLLSHLSDFETACRIAKEHAGVSPPDIDDTSYWQHQLNTIERIRAALASSQEKKFRFTIGDRVQKISGYKWPGIVVAQFKTIGGETRYVVECTVPEVSGALHIYSESQLALASKETTL